jgi:heat shock transcription factor
LRGRPDLLDEIKRKALEPDPAVKHRVELPGEVSYNLRIGSSPLIVFCEQKVAAQLGAMRDENRRVWEQLAAERRRVEKLAGVVARLWDVVGKGFPGSGMCLWFIINMIRRPSDLFYSTPIPVGLV